MPIIKGEVIDNPICQCCGQRPSVGVASSSLGAFSVAYCSECLSNNAEQKGMLLATYDDCDGNVSDWIYDLMAWDEGKYISFSDLISKYRGE